MVPVASRLWVGAELPCTVAIAVGRELTGIGVTAIAVTPRRYSRVIGMADPLPGFVCGEVQAGGAYRLGGPGVVKVWLCEAHGASLEAVMIAWLAGEQARPKQLSLLE